MSKDDITSWAAIIAAVVGAINILVTIANMILNSINQRKSNFANIVSSNRIKWIEDLRRDISHYIGSVLSVNRLKQARNSALSDFNKAVFAETKASFHPALISAEKDLSNKLEECVILQAYLHMKLDVDQDEQSLVYKNIIILWDKREDSLEMAGAIESLNRSTRDFLRKEWIKVERLR